MEVAKHNFTIQQGVRWRQTVTWKNNAGVPMNITDLTPHMQLRTRDGELITTVECTTSPLEGKVHLGLPTAITEALTFGTAEYVLELRKGAEVEYRLLKGIVILETGDAEDAA